MKYINQEGTLTEECMSWFVVLLFNILTFGLFMFIYLIYKKVWQHAIIYLVVSFLVIPIIIYPFYIGSIVRKNYLSNGWSEVTNIDEQLDFNTGDYVFISIMAIFVVIIAGLLAG
jgi:hypothetical protein